MLQTLNFVLSLEEETLSLTNICDDELDFFALGEQKFSVNIKYIEDSYL